MIESKYDLSIDAALILKSKEEYNLFLSACDNEICRIISTHWSNRVNVLLLRLTEAEYVRLKLIYGPDVWSR